MSSTMQELLGKTMKSFSEGSIVKGRVLQKRTNEVLVDIGYKSEGVISLSEFEDSEPLEVGSEVEVLLERLENDEGMVVLSKEKAAQKQNWEKIVAIFNNGGLISGKVKAVVKGGLMLNVGVEAFLPGSQVDIIAPKDLRIYEGKTLECKIVKLNEERKNVVLSRRELIEAERAEKRSKLLGGIEKGGTVKGTVKNITDFGAFIDLDGLDGLLHITDMSWSRLNHPSEMLKVGQEIEVLVLDIDREKERVSLGLKQKTVNPWDQIAEKYPVNMKVKGKVTNLVPYGAFVELEPGIEGLVHVSELSWTKRIARPADVLKKGDEIEAEVLEIDKANPRISLTLKHLADDPLTSIEARYKIGDLVTGKVSKVASFGAFIQLADEIDGLVHISQISNDRVEKVKEVLKIGQEVSARVIKVDKTERRIGLSIKAADYTPEQIEREKENYEALKPGEELSSMEAAFDRAEEDYRPGDAKKTK